MNRLYKKNEMTFAIVMIAIYVIGTVLAETLTAILGIAKLVPAIFHCIFTVVLAIWAFKNGHAPKYGLTVPRYNPIKYWFFIPLIAVACIGLGFGIKLQYTPMEAILHVISMVCVGFLEEIIFRGFLFAAMAKDNVKTAVIISSLTFGIGHIANLFNGQPLLATLEQIIFATVVGFTLVLIFYKGKSLLPCIIFHSLNNSLSAFEKTNEEIATSMQISAEYFEFISGAACILLLAVYALFIVKKCDITDVKH